MSNKRIQFLPFVRKRRGGPRTNAIPLDVPTLPEYLRGAVDTVYEDLVSDGTGVFTLTRFESLHAVPYSESTPLPGAMVTLTGKYTFLVNPAPSEGVMLRVFQTALRALVVPNLKDSERNYDDVPDYFNASYSLYRNRIKSFCPKHSLFTISLRYEEAPEKIAQEYLGSVDLWWVVMLYNGLMFPEQLSIGRTIRVPDASEVQTWLKRLKGVGGSETTDNQSEFSFKGKIVRV
jgi:hypothetical protein